MLRDGGKRGVWLWYAFILKKKEFEMRKKKEEGGGGRAWRVRSKSRDGEDALKTMDRTSFLFEYIYIYTYTHIHFEVSALQL